LKKSNEIQTIRILGGEPTIQTRAEKQKRRIDLISSLKEFLGFERS
jgi:hypothetical protein